MKRILSVFLILCTLFGVLPMAAMAKEETGAFDYEALYVKEGLAIWLDAFDSSAENETLDLAGGKWYSKVGDAYATLKGGVYSEETPMGWRSIPGGGIGWTQDGNAVTARQENGIYFDTSLIPEADYTLEMTVAQNGLTTATGERYVALRDNEAGTGPRYGIGGGECIAIGTFRDYGYFSLFEIVGRDTPPADQLGHKWYISALNYASYSKNYSLENVIFLCRDSNAAQNYGVGDYHVLSLRMAWESESQVNARVAYDNATTVGGSFSASEMQKDVLPKNNAGLNKAGEPYEGNVFFQLLAGMPSEVRSIRIYHRALSEAEQWKNQFADVARFYGMDLTGYLSVPQEVQALIHERVGALGFTSDKATAEAAVAEAVEAYRLQKEEEDREKAEREALLQEYANRPSYDKYYVQEGLVLWLDGFVAFEELNGRIDRKNGRWYSKLDDGIYAEIGGVSHWQESKDGRGFGYRMTKAQYGESLVDGICPYGLHFDPALLPEGNYTVETVATLVGLTNEDGTRYVDPPTGKRYGIYTDKYSSFSFGPFKAMSFLCTSEAQNGTPIGSRWCYTKLEWGDHNGKAGKTDDYSINEMNGVTPVTFSVTRRVRSSEMHVYTTYTDNKPTILLNTSLVVEDPEPEFQLFKGMASTVYAVRLYNRLLTEEERAQNHAADLLSYYGLDTALYDLAVEGLSADMRDSFYHAFDEMDFTLEKEEAQKVFVNCLAEAWLSYAGISLRLDQAIGLRNVFQVNRASVEALTASGFQVEMGALLDLGASVPTYADADHRVVFRTLEGDWAESFFFSEGLAAMAVHFQNPTPEMAGGELSFRGYILLKTPAGEEYLLYSECPRGAFDKTVLSGYTYLRELPEYEKNAFVKRTVENAYERITLLLDAELGSDENDGVTLPIRTLAKAYEMLLSLFDGAAPVDVTLQFAQGTYRTAEKLEFSKDHFSQRYIRLHFEGAEGIDEGEESILSGNLVLPNDGFQRVEGEAYYAYQFEKDAEGNYPDFYYFYANGVIQEVAHRGYNRTYEAETVGGGISAMWRVPDIFHGVDEEIAGTNKGKVDTSYLEEGYKLYLPAVAFEGLREEDFTKMEFHIPIMWYYKVIHLDRVDLEDRDEDGNVAVYFKESDMAGYSAGHAMKGNYFWLQNAMSFLDEPGEFYYDDAKGTLYYLPGEGVDMETGVFEIPAVDHILAFLDLSDISFRNMVFTGTDNQAFDEYYHGTQAKSAPGDYGANTKSALYLKNSTRTVFDYCIFREVAANALVYAGVTKDMTVDSCRFFHVGSSAISVGERNGTWDDKTNANENILVTNNYFNDLAFATRGSVGFIISVVKGLELSYNTFLNTSYSAVSIGWRWAPVTWEFGEDWHVYNANVCNNYFAGFMTDMQDGGAIYTLGGNVDESYHSYFNELHGNVAYFNEVTWDGKGMVMPYYHDGASSNWHTHDNVEILNPFRKVKCTIYLQSIETQLVHNIMVEGNHIIANYKTPEQFVNDYDLTERDLELAIFGELPYGKIQSDGRRASRVEEARFLYQRNNTVYECPNDASDEVFDIIDMAGSFFMLPDSIAILYDEMQPVYEEYEIFLEEEYDRIMQEKAQ